MKRFTCALLFLLLFAPSISLSEAVPLYESFIKILGRASGTKLIQADSVDGLSVYECTDFDDEAYLDILSLCADYGFRLRENYLRADVMHLALEYNESTLLLITYDTNAQSAVLSCSPTLCDRVLSRQLTAGDEVLFGAFEQDDDETNGPEPIEWTVLEADGSKALLLSKKIIEEWPYLGSSWESCDLRRKLNGDFLQIAFTREEAEYIIPTNVPADENEYYPSRQGPDTLDKIFLLSIDEVKRYFPEKESRAYENTAYTARTKCENTVASGKWGLRTVARSNGIVFVSCVDDIDIGALYKIEPIDYRFGIRPAMWVALTGPE